MTFALLRVFASLSVGVESSEETLDFSAGRTAGGGALFGVAARVSLIVNAGRNFALNSFCPNFKELE